MTRTLVWTRPAPKDMKKLQPPTALPATEGVRDVVLRVRDKHRCDTPDPRIEYADSLVPSAHVRRLPTEMSTGGSSRQRSTFPLGIRGTRMSTR